MNNSTLSGLAIGSLAAAAILVLATPAGAEERVSQKSKVSSFDAIMEVATDEGSVTFIDESIGGDFGVGILEQGTVNLAPYYEQEATPLEIYLALGKGGKEPPPFLVRAHEEARRINVAIPVEPRTLGTLVYKGGVQALGYYSFDQDTSNCWDWGNVDQYNTLVGNDPDSFGGHESGQAYQQFLNWAGIAGTNGFNGSWTSNGIYFEENAEQSDQSYATGFSHERAFAICVTHAIVQPSESQFECEVSNGAYENTVDYRLRLYVESSNGDTWHSDGINLLGYGDGARYRSSSNAKRRYDLRVVDDSKKSLFCKERYDVFWRARTQGPAITNDILIAPK